MDPQGPPHGHALRRSQKHPPQVLSCGGEVPRTAWVSSQEHQAHKQTLFVGLQISRARSNRAIPPTSSGITIYKYECCTIFLNVI